MNNVGEFQKDLQDFLTKQLNIQVKDTYLFECALTHKSFAHDYAYVNLSDYDSLEFLGDSLISGVISSNLFHMKKTSDNMTKLRQQIVQSKSLIISAKKINLDKLIRTGKSLKHQVSDSIIEDVFEAFCAAIYVTFGLVKAQKFIEDTLGKNFVNQEFSELIDYKTLLQEAVYKKYKTTIRYGNTFDEVNQTYDVTCYVDDKMNVSVEDTKTIKEAEQQCAKMIGTKNFSNS